MFVQYLLTLRIFKQLSLPATRLKCQRFIKGRNFHTSSCMYLRQARGRINDELQRVSSIKADIPFSEPHAYLNENINEAEENIDDIFGIESDHGAIRFDNAVPRFDKFQELRRKKKEQTEVLRKTPFGHMRLDNENLHPLRPSHRRKSDKIAIESSETKESLSSDNPYNDELSQQNRRKKFERVPLNQAAVGSLNTFQTENHYGNENQIDDNSFNKINYSSAVNNRNFSSVEKSKTAADEVTDTIWEQLGYKDIDIHYNSTNKDSNEELCTISDVKPTESKLILNEGFSEIDEQYFQESLRHDHLKGKADDDKFSDIFKNRKVKENSTIVPQKLSEINKQKFKTEMNIKTSEHKTSVTLDDDSNEPRLSIIDEQYFTESLTNEEDLSNSKDSISINNEIFSHDIEKLSLSRNKTESIDVKYGRTSSSFPRKSKTKVQEENKNGKSKLEDHFKKMRHEQSKANALGTKDHTTRDIKLDSKGFRILTNQVPDLSLLTRAELMADLKTRILYSDDDILVLNKPYNLVIHEAKTNKDVDLSSLLGEFAHLIDGSSPDPKLYTVHRLDKTTTGCLLLARNEMAAQKLKSMFVQRQITKAYWIVTSGIPERSEGIIDIPIAEGRIGNKSRMVLHPDLPDEMPYKSHSKRGKRAITQYTVIATSGNAALIEAKSETGLKHQIRVHFGFGLKCPIIGDHKYSHLDKLAPQKLPSDLLQRLQVRQSKVRHIAMHIHARSVMLPNYFNSRNLFVTAPLPDHMRRNLQSLKFKKK